MTDYATIDWMLFHQFAALSRLRPEEVFPAYFSQRTIDRKAELIESEMWRLSPNLVAVQKRLIRRIKGAARRRTQIAHAHLMNGAGGPMRLLLYGNEVRLRPFDSEFIKRTIHQFHTLAADLAAFEATLIAIAPDILISRISSVYAPIDRQLQRLPVPLSPAGQSEVDELDEICKRIGIDPAAIHSIALSVEKDMGLFGWPKPPSMKP